VEGNRYLCHPFAISGKAAGIDISHSLSGEGTGTAISHSIFGVGAGTDTSSVLSDGEQLQVHALTLANSQDPFCEERRPDNNHGLFGGKQAKKQH
jgi:hypothetical protein